MYYSHFLFFSMISIEVSCLLFGFSAFIVFTVFYSFICKKDFVCYLFGWKLHCFNGRWLLWGTTVKQTDERRLAQCSHKTNMGHGRNHVLWRQSFPPVGPLPGHAMSLWGWRPLSVLSPCLEKEKKSICSYKPRNLLLWHFASYENKVCIWLKKKVYLCLWTWHHTGRLLPRLYPPLSGWTGSPRRFWLWWVGCWWGRQDWTWPGGFGRRLRPHQGSPWSYQILQRSCLDTVGKKKVNSYKL